MTIQGEPEWLAWCAGFYDGEGSTGFYTFKHNPRGRISMVVGQKQSEPGVLETFHEAIGIGKISRHSQREQDRWRWAVYRPAEVAVAGSLIWPWLGKVKRAQYIRAWCGFCDLRGWGQESNYPFDVEVLLAVSQARSIQVP